MLAEGCVFLSIHSQYRSLETSKGWQKVAWSIHIRGHQCCSLGRGLPLTLPNIRQVNGRDQRLRPQSPSWCLVRSASSGSL